MSKIILVLGGSGMLGSSLHRYFTKCTDFSVVSTVRSESARLKLASMGFESVISGVDVTNKDILEGTFIDVKPDYVFNCIGLIKQLSESKVETQAVKINSLLPHELAMLSTKHRAKLIHFSTDCVFSGEKGGYRESDVPDAFDIYGRSKLLGEVGYGGHLTLRTSIIGHEIATNLSLVDWFLSQKGEVKGYSRALFSGLPTCYMAEFIDKYILPKSDFTGLYHLSVEPINKFELLSLVKDIYGVQTIIENNQDFSINRSLNSDNLRSNLGFSPPSWTELIEKMHNEYEEYFC